MAGEVKHFFVLMLENRSFDHMLGRCGVAGVDGISPEISNPGENGPVWTSADAPDIPTSAPNHEYCDVQEQLFGTRTPDPTAEPTMSGFVRNSGPSVMQGFTRTSLPILNQLAAEFVVCDHWFASMPGPTWPNRFFVHAGSSGGLDNSPSDPHAAIAVLDSDGWWGFEFENGTIYDRMNVAGLKWRVYHGDHFPQVLSIKGLVNEFVKKNDVFRSIAPGDPHDPFARDIRDNYDIAYTFIEPNYGILGGSSNSQHPKGSASAGEALIKYVYETVRSSRIWDDSVLVITYDEHGGFYDHEAPGKCAEPGDDPLNYKQAEHPKDCRFDRYGVRVPTLIISPRVGRGAVWNTTTDHTSILSTLRSVFPTLGDKLTDRDGAAPPFKDLLTGPLRQNTPAVLTDPEGQSSQSVRADTRQVSYDDENPPDGTLRGFCRIAADVARASQISPLLNSNTFMTQADVVLAARSAGRVDLESLQGDKAVVVPKMATTAEARDFIQSVVKGLKRVSPK